MDHSALKSSLRPVEPNPELAFMLNDIRQAYAPRPMSAADRARLAAAVRVREAGAVRPRRLGWFVALGGALVAATVVAYLAFVHPRAPATLPSAFDHATALSPLHDRALQDWEQAADAWVEEVLAVSGAEAWDESDDSATLPSGYDSLSEALFDG